MGTYYYSQPRDQWLQEGDCYSSIPGTNGLRFKVLCPGSSRPVIEISGPCGKYHQMKVEEAKALREWLIRFAASFPKREGADLMTDLKALLRKHGGE